MQLVLFHREQCRVGAGATLCVMLMVGVPSQGSAQQPVPGPSQPSGLSPQTPSSSIPAYRLPALSLVQPAAGGSVAEDRPVIVFRFAPGEPNDPIDGGSFVLTVDGRDRTTLFQIASGEAWGPLAPSNASTEPPISAGAHQVVARICSSRGACTETATTVVVVASSAVVRETTPSERKRSIIDVLLAAARKLLEP